MRVRVPTTRADWRLIARTARLVLGIPRYALVAGLAWVGALSLFVFSQNLALVGFALGGALSITDRLSLLVSLYPFAGTAYTLASGTVLVAVATLVAVDVALAVYHLREHRLSVEQGGSAVGVLLGTLGAGCAACGTAVVAGLLSLVGAAGVLAVLPLEGLEFSLLAAAVLVLSIYWLADGMRGGEIDGCPVDPR
ncbi:MAG: hypothetical protein ABEI96_06440 [Haloarculaceae archaeon]